MPSSREGNEGAAKEEAKPNADKKEEVKPSLEGLVKMKRDEKFIHAHPSTVKNHKENGWKEV